MSKQEDLVRDYFDLEVETPILNSPFEEPKEYWSFGQGEMPTREKGRRKAGYFYRDPKEPLDDSKHGSRGDWRELCLVNKIRERLAKWQSEDFSGASRISYELIKHWERDGREKRLFFAQLEAAKTVIFLKEARPDLLQGIEVPYDELTGDRADQGYSAFQRYACKMATGSGKTTVMAMLAAWSILNKVNDRTNKTYSDVVLVVCPNVTIRNRLGELDPQRGEASLYRTRDIVPKDWMPDLTRGKVLVTNWHVFEPKSVTMGDTSAKVMRAGVPTPTSELIHIGDQNTTSRGKRYLTLDTLQRQVAMGMLEIKEEIKDKQGHLIKVRTSSVKYVQSDTSLINEVLGREVGGKQNILVFNDEAHHAYRIGREVEEEDEDIFGDDEEADEFFKEATVWVDGLDKIHKHRGVNFCVDLSATPFYLARVGQQANTPFPWVVSEFGLTDAIESGLTKIPSLALQDTTGAQRAAYFNIWQWIMKQLTPAERGAKRAAAKPEAVLRWASRPISHLAQNWLEERDRWKEHYPTDPRRPVFIIVCKNTKIAKAVFDWLAEDKKPKDVSSMDSMEFRNTEDRTNTIRVDTKVIQETDSDAAKADESLWMRLTLDTVGKIDWPRDLQGSPIYPDDFLQLAKKLDRPLHPPGRDIQCIVSVGMLTEGWDCNTVTHIVGVRPFMSQLLCEQVVGRGLRRRSYELTSEGKLEEEIAQVLGVPFEIIPFKASKKGEPRQQEQRTHVHAIPAKAKYEIKFPRVVGYQQAIRKELFVDWDSVAPVYMDALQIPTEVTMKASTPNNNGRLSLYGPGKIDHLTLEKFRAEKRRQQLVFELSKDLTRDFAETDRCELPPQALFPKIVAIVDRFLDQKIIVRSGSHLHDVFLSPYYGYVIERLVEAIRPDTNSGEAPELPRYDSRGEGSTKDVEFWPKKDVREVANCHLNYVVADTKKWEQAAAYLIDNHKNTEAFVKNDHLGFVIPYLHNNEHHDYVPDFIVRTKGKVAEYVIIETKGYDELAEIKAQAAQRWVAAVNADGRYGKWQYFVARNPTEIIPILDNFSK